MAFWHHMRPSLNVIDCRNQVSERLVDLPGVTLWVTEGECTPLLPVEHGLGLTEMFTSGLSSAAGMILLAFCLSAALGLLCAFLMPEGMMIGRRSKQAVTVNGGGWFMTSDGFEVYLEPGDTYIPKDPTKPWTINPFLTYRKK